MPRRGFLIELPLTALKRPTNMNRLSNYVKETRAEMSHVNWPSREQTIRFTTLVILVSLATAALLGLSDFVFSRLLTLLF